MRVGIALGSNVGNRAENLSEARTRIQRIQGVQLPCLNSRIFETEPVDTAPDTDQFLNAVIEVGYPDDPLRLLHALLAIEEAMGRPRIHERNAPRTVDLDILYAGNLQRNEPGLQIPHPRLHQRLFVLQPLNDIRPDLFLPGFSQNVAELLQNLDDPARVQLYPWQW